MTTVLAAPPTRSSKQRPWYTIHLPYSRQLRTVRCPHPTCGKRILDFCAIGAIEVVCINGHGVRIEIDLERLPS